MNKPYTGRMASTRNTNHRNHLLSLTPAFHLYRARVAANSPKHPDAISDRAAVSATRRESVRAEAPPRSAGPVLPMEAPGNAGAVFVFDWGERCAGIGDPFLEHRLPRNSAQATGKKVPTGICVAALFVKVGVTRGRRIPERLTPRRPHSLTAAATIDSGLRPWLRN